MLPVASTRVSAVLRAGLCVLHPARACRKDTPLDEGILDAGELADADVDDGGDKAGEDPDQQHDDPAREADPHHLLSINQSIINQTSNQTADPPVNQSIRITS